MNETIKVIGNNTTIITFMFSLLLLNQGITNTAAVYIIIKNIPNETEEKI